MRPLHQRAPPVETTTTSSPRPRPFRNAAIAARARAAPASLRWMSSKTTTNVRRGTVVGPTLVETRDGEPRLAGRAIGRRDRLELLDLLADAVLVENEVLGPEIEHGTASLVDDTDVDLDDVGLRLEPGPAGPDGAPT